MDKPAPTQASTLPDLKSRIKDVGIHDSFSCDKQVSIFLLHTPFAFENILCLALEPDTHDIVQYRRLRLFLHIVNYSVGRQYYEIPIIYI